MFTEGVIYDVGKNHILTSVSEKPEILRKLLEGADGMHKSLKTNLLKSNQANFPQGGSKRCLLLHFPKDFISFLLLSYVVSLMFILYNLHVKLIALE